MKTVITIFLMLFSLRQGWALPVGNPADASLLCNGIFLDKGCDDGACGPNWCQALSFRFGFYGDYVYNRYLQIVAPTRNQIERSRLYTNAAYLALNGWNRLDLFASLGQSKATFSGNAESFGAPLPGQVLMVESRPSFSWSLGGRLTLWECRCFLLGVEGQYFRTQPPIQSVIIGGGNSLAIYPNFATRYREWQVGGGVAYRTSLIVPYAALKYSRTRFHVDNMMGTGVNITNRKHWGYELGATIVVCDAVSITTAGRFADEIAFHVNGQIRF